MVQHWLTCNSLLLLLAAGVLVTGAVLTVGTTYIEAGGTICTLTSAVTTNIVSELDGSFTIPTGEYAEWEMRVLVINSGPEPLVSVVVDENFGAELGVETLGASQGSVEYELTGAAQKVHLTWVIGDLGPGRRAELTLKVYTKQNPAGRQEYSSPGDYHLNSGSTLVYRMDGSQYSTSGPRIPVSVREKAWVSFDITASRLDWRVRKPGLYVSKALQLRLASNSSVAVQFAGFADLTASENGSLTIPTLYGFGPDLQEVEYRGWIPAQDLEQFPLHFGQSKTLRTGVALDMWNMVFISGRTQASEYEDGGIITIVLDNAGDFVD